MGASRDGRPGRARSRSSAPGPCARTRTAGRSCASSPRCVCRRRPVPRSTPSRSCDRRRSRPRCRTRPGWWFWYDANFDEFPPDVNYYAGGNTKFDPGPIEAETLPHDGESYRGRSTERQNAELVDQTTRHPVVIVDGEEPTEVRSDDHSGCPMARRSVFSRVPWSWRQHLSRLGRATCRRWAAERRLPWVPSCRGGRGARGRRHRARGRRPARRPPPCPAERRASVDRRGRRR